MNLLSLRAAARLLHLDHRTLKRAITNGTCPAVRLGRRWKLEETALRRWASGGTALPEIVIRLPHGAADGSTSQQHAGTVTRQPKKEANHE